MDTQVEGRSTLGLFGRARTEPLFRLRLMLTGFVVWMFITLGWLSSISGSVFPDLRQIIHKDLDTASWIFTDSNIGYMLGALVMGILFDRFNRMVLLTAVTTMSAVTIAIIPWCEQFAALLAVNFINGVCFGGIDVGGNTQVASLWGRDSAPFMQAIHFGFSFGGILSPLTAEPFVAEKHCLTTNDSMSAVSTETMPYSVSLTTAGVKTTTTECEEVYGETHIQFAYLIAALVGLTAAFPFLLINQMSRNKLTELQSKDDDTKEEPTPSEKSTGQLPELSFKLKCLFVSLLMGLISLYAGIEQRFSTLISSFVVDYQDWTKADSLHLASLFWASFAAGRFIGIGVARILRPSSMILVYILALILSFIGFLIAAEYKIRVLIWVCTATTGLSMSTIFPSVFTWTAESILMVTGKISAAYIVGVSLFNSFLPLLYGYLMDNVDNMYFTYLLLSQSILSLLVYVVIRVFINIYIKPLETANAI